MADVRNFGAAGDGQHDDTEAIRHAVADGDGQLEFSPGTYRISETIEINLAQTGYRAIVGTGGAARILMTGPGPALRFVGTHEGTAFPTTVQPPVWQRERFPTVDGLAIEGDNPEADGIELVRTMQATLTRLHVRHVRNGVILRERNRNFLLADSHIYDNSAIGVLLDRCNLHQAIIVGCHISYNRRAGIHSIGGDLHNLEITGNDIEYNHDAEAEGSADIWFDTLDGRASEIAIASNTIQALPSPGGTNVRLIGQGTAPDCSVRLITISGNVLGSQETNIEIRHAERIAIAGNTIYDGKAGAIRCENAALLALGDNTFGWAFGPQRDMHDGIVLTRCWGANLQALTMHATRAGDESSGGAICLVECEDSAIAGCQILAPRARGIELVDCTRCRISDNSILERGDVARLIAAIAVRGGRDNLVQNNMLSRGSQEAVDADSESATVANNTVVA